jgi:hypothetical protein
MTSETSFKNLNTHANRATGQPVNGSAGQVKIEQSIHPLASESIDPLTR